MTTTSRARSRAASWSCCARSASATRRTTIAGAPTPSSRRYDAARPFAATYNDYLALFRDELPYPSPYRRSLAIEDMDGQHIGNVMYYNIDTIRREAEIGITIGERVVLGAAATARDAVTTLVAAHLPRRRDSGAST